MLKVILKFKEDTGPASLSYAYGQDNKFSRFLSLFHYMQSNVKITYKRNIKE